MVHNYVGKQTLNGECGLELGYSDWGGTYKDLGAYYDEYSKYIVGLVYFYSLKISTVNLSILASV